MSKGIPTTSKDWGINCMSECIWKEENGIDSDGLYVTGCDNVFIIIEGNPKGNNFKFCPYCGKALKEKQTK